MQASTILAAMPYAQAMTAREIARQCGHDDGRAVAQRLYWLARSHVVSVVQPDGLQPHYINWQRQLPL